MLKNTCNICCPQATCAISLENIELQKKKKNTHNFIYMPNQRHCSIMIMIMMIIFLAAFCQFNCPASSILQFCNLLLLYLSFRRRFVLITLTFSCRFLTPFFMQTWVFILVVAVAVAVIILASSHLQFERHCVSLMMGDLCEFRTGRQRCLRLGNSRSHSHSHSPRHVTSSMQKERLMAALLLLF